MIIITPHTSQPTDLGMVVPLALSPLPLWSNLNNWPREKHFLHHLHGHDIAYVAQFGSWAMPIYIFLLILIMIFNFLY